MFGSARGQLLHIVININMHSLKSWEEGVVREGRAGESLSFFRSFQGVLLIKIATLFDLILIYFFDYLKCNL